MGWQKGPLPPDTYNWGGVVPDDHAGSGFYFADFRGDHVVIHPGDPKNEQRLEADQVRWWNNCLTLPPDNTFTGAVTGYPWLPSSLEEN
jgi:hypothetical protein